MTDQLQPPIGAPPPGPPVGSPYAVPPQPYGAVPPQPYGAVPGMGYGATPGQPYGAVPMQALGLEPAVLTPEPRRRTGLVFAGIGVIAAGVVAAIVLFAVSLTMPEKTVAKFARAPSGCTTTLEFSKRATFTLYVETKGSTGIGSGDCPANGASYDRGDDDLPQVALTLLDSADQQVPMSAVDGPSYSAGEFEGQAVQSVEITEPGSYRLTVTSDATDFAIAVGGDPDADAMVLVNIGIGAVVIAVVIGGVLILLGLRKKAVPAARPIGPQHSAGPQGWSPQPTVPGAVPGYPAQPGYGYPPQQSVPPNAPTAPAAGQTWPPAPPAPPSGQGWGAPQQ